MKKSIRLLTMLVCFATMGLLCACGDDEKEEATNSLLYGKWNVVEASINGGDVKPLNYIMIWEFRADGTFVGNENGEIYESRYSFIDKNTIILYSSSTSNVGVEISIRTLTQSKLVIAFSDVDGDSYVAYLNRL